MTLDERMEIAEAAIAMTPADKTVVVGVTSTSIADAIELARHAEERNAGGVLCAAPFYFENSPAGMLAFLGELDAAIGVDLVLYDNPVATKTKLAAGDVAAGRASSSICARSSSPTTRSRRSRSGMTPGSTSSAATTRSCSATSRRASTA